MIITIITKKNINIKWFNIKNVFINIILINNSVMIYKLFNKLKKIKII